MRAGGLVHSHGECHSAARMPLSGAPATTSAVQGPRLRPAPSARCQAKKNAVGFKYDKSNLRWVRDDRYAGAVENMPEELKKITPMTGSAYTIWPMVHTELNGAGIKAVSPAEAAKMQKTGWTIVDVRIEGDFQKQHATGSINLPVYRFVQGTAFWDQVKKIAMAGFAMKATERDPDYLATALSRLKKGQKVIMTCAIGGSLDTKLRLRPDKYKDGINDLDRSFGRESRSLKAAYELLKGGWNSSNMVFMEGGFQQWRYQGFPTSSGSEGEEEEL